MDAAEPPRIVVEGRESCAGPDRVEEFLHDSLGKALAPAHAWTVTMRVVPTGSHGLRVQGEISNELGLPMAARVLSAPAGDCRGLARAVGVWASLVLEQEVVRAKAAPVAASPPAQASAAPASDPMWPAPAEDPKPDPDFGWFQRHEDDRTFELGLAGFLMAGTGVGALAGVSPYAIIEAGNGVFLRPSLAFGESLPALNSPPIVNAALFAARLDACLRLPGLYTKDRGMQLDACGGADVGVVSDETDNIDVPFLAVGPSLDLRGELGSALAASIRGVAGLNLTSEHTGNVFQPLFSGRIELAFSFKVR